MKDTQMLLMVEGVIETVRNITINTELYSFLTGTDMEVVVDPGSPLLKMLRRQFERGGTFDYKVLMSEPYWFAVCSFSAQVKSIGINEHEVSVGLIVTIEPIWKRVSKQIWNRRKVA